MPPLNTATVAQVSATLNCASDTTAYSSLVWFFAPLSSSSYSLGLCSGEPNTTGYTYSKAGNSCNITVTSPTTSQAGYYTCVDLVQGGQYSAALIVFG